MFIYHLIQPGFVGQTIYPLNQLEAIHPEIISKAMKKYEDRADLQEIRQRRVPFLDCTMDDLVCFVSVDFALLLQAFSEIHGIEERIERTYLRVDTDLLKQEHLSITFHDDAVEDASGKMIPTVDGHLRFSDARHLLPTVPPAEQLEMYREDFRGGRKGPLAAYLPHVFYKGVVEDAAVAREVFVWDPKSKT